MERMIENLEKYNRVVQSITTDANEKIDRHDALSAELHKELSGYKDDGDIDYSTIRKMYAVFEEQAELLAVLEEQMTRLKKLQSEMRCSMTSLYYLSREM